MTETPAQRREHERKERIDAWVAKHVAQAPPLNDRQAALLQRLFAPRLKKSA